MKNAGILTIGDEILQGHTVDLNSNHISKELTIRDGFAIVSIGWITMAIFSALPLYVSNFYFDNYFISYLDCYFGEVLLSLLEEWVLFYLQLHFFLYWEWVEFSCSEQKSRVLLQIN